MQRCACTVQFMLRGASRVTMVLHYALPDHARGSFITRCVLCVALPSVARYLKCNGVICFIARRPLNQFSVKNGQRWV